jgi:hypothetical protein
MCDLGSPPPPVLTPALYGLILASPRLRRRLLPQGLLTSPYEVLSYKASPVLEDTEGMHATLVRRERIRFLQDGVSAILDHVWGDGIVVTSYKTTAGTIEGSLRDEGRRHLVIGLRRPMRRGEVFEFEVTRSLAAGLTKGEEWLETAIDHPVRLLTCNVVFPKGRPCQRVSLDDGRSEVSLPIVRAPNGQTLAHFTKHLPSAHVAYALRWTW